MAQLYSIYWCALQARAQQLLQAKYRRLSDNFDTGSAEIQSALDQVQRCFDLLRGDSAPAQPPAQPQPTMPESALDEEEWEDIDAGKGEESRHMQERIVKGRIF